MSGPDESTRYRALLIDLDGVIRRWPSSNSQIEESCGLPEGSLFAAAFDARLLTPAITGLVSDEKWRESIAALLRERYPDSRAEEAVTAWSAAPGSVDARVVNLLTRLRGKIRIALVSNATSRLQADLAPLGLDRIFHAIVNSSEVGIAKPEAGIFYAALDRVGASCDEALFVDDTARNVEAARKLGITSLHYSGYDSLTRFLRQNGLVPGNATA